MTSYKKPCRGRENIRSIYHSSSLAAPHVLLRRHSATVIQYQRLEYVTFQGLISANGQLEASLEISQPHRRSRRPKGPAPHCGRSRHPPKAENQATLPSWAKQPSRPARNTRKVVLPKLGLKPRSAPFFLDRSRASSKWSILAMACRDPRSRSKGPQHLQQANARRLGALVCSHV